jgi:hypothetical protein
LPEGYRVDLSSDPDAPVLRRPDGTAAARFGAWGSTDEVVEREALEDLLRGSEEPLGRGSNGPGSGRGALGDRTPGERRGRAAPREQVIARRGPEPAS